MRSRNVNIDPGTYGSTLRTIFTSSESVFTSPECLFTSPESLFTSLRNLYSHRSGISIHIHRNTQLGKRWFASCSCAQLVLPVPPVSSTAFPVGMLFLRERQNHFSICRQPMDWQHLH